MDDIEFSQGKMHYSNHSAVRTSLMLIKLETKVSTMEIAFAAVKRAVEATIQINVSKRNFYRIWQNLRADHRD